MRYSLGLLAVFVCTVNGTPRLAVAAVATWGASAAITYFVTDKIAAYQHARLEKYTIRMIQQGRAVYKKDEKSEKASIKEVAE